MSEARRRPLYACILVAFFITLPAIAPAAEKRASIIIDDLGNSLDYGAAVLDIEAPLTLAMLPLSDYGATLANLAHKQGKEVMLHLPLQSIESHAPAAGTLYLHMTHAQFVRQLDSDLASIPHLSGVNNHMGSLLTQHPGYMDWLMQELEHRDLYFVDSRTTTKSVAGMFADKHGIAHMDRDIFLDPDFDPHTLQRQFDRFIDIASRNGSAIAIAHPHPRTLEFLRQHIGELEKHEIRLVPVSRLLSSQMQHEVTTHVAHTGATGTGL
jgi:uncharacterized protein